jgi:coenzyme PQQ precursor peptide PqqA
MIASGNSDQISEEAMAWKKPRIIEIAVGTEINSYACASVTK